MWRCDWTPPLLTLGFHHLAAVMVTPHTLSCASIDHGEGVTSYYYSLGGTPVLPDIAFKLIPEAVAGTWQAKISGTMTLLSRSVWDGCALL